MDTLTIEGAGRLTGKVDVGIVTKETEEAIWAYRMADTTKNPLRFSKANGRATPEDAASWWQIPMGVLRLREYNKRKLPGTYSLTEYRALKPNQIVPGSGGMTKAEVDNLPRNHEWAKLSDSLGESPQTVPANSGRRKCKVKTATRKATPAAPVAGTPAAKAEVAQLGKTTLKAAASAPKAVKTFELSRQLLATLTSNLIVSRPGRRMAGYGEFKSAVESQADAKGAVRTLALDRVGAEFLHRSIVEKGAAGSMKKSGTEFAEQLAASFKLNGHATAPTATAKPAVKADTAAVKQNAAVTPTNGSKPSGKAPVPSTGKKAGTVSATVPAAPVRTKVKARSK